MNAMLRFSWLALAIAVPAHAVPPEGRRVLVGDSSKKHVAIINAKGGVEWEYKIRSLHDLHMLPNGNVLLQTDMQHLAEVTPDKKVVWSYDASKMNGNDGKRVEVHAFQRLPDGLTMIAESGRGRIIEVDKDGKIHKEIKLKVGRPNAHRDTRLVRKLESGNYLVCHEGDGAVREYDGTSRVVWEYRIPLFDKKRKGGHGPEAWGNQTFGAVRLPGGNTLIATGNGHSVIEVTPAKEIVWHLKQNDLPGITLAWVTTLEVHPNGNIVLGNCHAGKENPQIIEITKEKKVVWSFKNWVHCGNSLPNSQILGVKGKVIR